MSTVNALDQMTPGSSAESDNAPAPGIAVRGADPYARWHGFLIDAVLGHDVVASVGQFLAQRVSTAWSLDRR